MASFQTAETVGRGKSTIGVGVTYNRYSQTVDEEDTEDSTVEVSVPAVHGWYRYGVTDRLELHAMVWVPMGSTLGAKYQLVGSAGKTGPAISLGADVGYLKITSGEGEDESSVSILDGHVPLYLGYRASPSFAAYLTPRYLLRSISGGEASLISHQVGSALGVALGSGTVFHLEAVALYDMTYETTALTGGLGLSF